jgi:hypothetical protein
MSVSWLIDFHASSTNDTLRLHDMREREKRQNESERHTLTQVYAFMKNGDQIGRVACVALRRDTVHRF